MNKILSICFLLSTILLSYANPVVYKQCVPNNGSDITSWNFTLEFDITAALEAAKASNPNDEVGIGVFGANTSTLKNYTTLYKGDSDTGDVLATAYTTSLNGKSEDFKVNGNTINISFDESIPIIKGQKYTVEIKNDFYLYIKGSVKRINSTRLSFSDSPLVLTFYGGDLSSSSLFVENCSLENELESISDFTFNLNSAFNFSDGAKVLIKEGENEIGSTTQLSVAADNEKQLKVNFTSPVVLYTGRAYSIQLPARSLTLKDNPGVSNTAFETKVSGMSSISYSVSEYSPKENQVLLPESASISFDIPEGKTIVPPGSFPTGHAVCEIYSEGKENEAMKKYTTNFTADNKGFLWNLSDIEFLPSTKYYLKKEQGSTTLFDLQGNHCPEYRNEGITISWTTPSVEEMNLPVITKSCFGSVKVGKHDDSSVPEFKDGGSYKDIDILEMEVIKDSYEYNGQKYKGRTSGSGTWKLFDVTTGSRVFIKEIVHTVVQRENRYEYYSVDQLWVKSVFYQGRTYEIVLEENNLTLDNSFPKNLKNYLRSEEVVYKVIGATPTSVELKSKTISDNEDVDALYNAIWVFNGEFEMKEGAKVNYTIQSSDNLPYSGFYPLEVNHMNGDTYLFVNLVSKNYGTPETYSSPKSCTLTLPEGTLYYAGDESITNKEIVTPFNGVPKKKAEAETVNVSLEVNGVHTSSHEAAKDKPYTFTLNHDANWAVESVSHNGKALTGSKGTYTIKTLTEADNNIKATLKFASDVVIDGTTGIAELPDSNVTVTTDSDKHIIIEGLIGNENLAIYSMNGLLVKDFSADGNNIFHVSVDNGIYIVLVVDAEGNRKAAKVQVK